MSQFKFDGEIVDFNETQLKFITDALEILGFKNCTVKVESVGKVDDNYGSNVKRFTIERNGPAFKVIVKIAPTNPQMRISAISQIAFKNEGVMYSKVLPKFAELETKAGIPEGEKLRFAECFGVFLEEPHETILLEDLKESNFCILDKFKPLNDNTVRLMLKTYAKLHALSFLLKHEDLDKYKSFTDELVNPWQGANKSAEMNAYFISLEEEVLEFVDSVEYKKIITGSLSCISKNIVNNRKRDECFSTIQQGDAWTNNFMFTLENNTAVQCCMIDYQNSYESYPAADILFMIFNCTDYQTRSTHYQHWIEYYYNNLEDRLRRFGLNGNSIYPRKVFDKDLKRMGKITFGQAIMAASILIREGHEGAHFKDFMNDSDLDDKVVKYKLSNLGESSLRRYKEKFNGLLKSYEEIGFDVY